MLKMICYRDFRKFFIWVCIEEKKEFSWKCKKAIRCRVSSFPNVSNTIVSNNIPDFLQNTLWKYVVIQFQESITCFLLNRRSEGLPNKASDIVKLSVPLLLGILVLKEIVNNLTDILERRQSRTHYKCLSVEQNWCCYQWNWCSTFFFAICAPCMCV